MEVKVSPPRSESGSEADAADRRWKLLKRLGIWAGFLGLLTVLRDFLSLVIITFIVCYIANSLASYLTDRFGWRRRVAVTGIFAVIAVLIVLGVVFVFPRAVSEGQKLYAEIPETYQKAKAATSKIIDSALIDRFNAIGIGYNLQDVFKSAAKQAASGINTVARLGFHLFLSLIFGFLILFDLPKMKAGVQGLSRSRLAGAYHEVGPHLASFFHILGKVFEAQVLIATVNTLLTFAGLLFLDIPYAVVLSLVVFFGGLIPVLGVIISSTPIVLVGLKIGGLMLALKVVAMITLVHILEAYVLNPQIMGEHLSVHPLLVLVILLIGETYFGIWGLLLGVPVAIYVFRDLLEAEPAGDPSPGTPVS